YIHPLSLHDALPISRSSLLNDLSSRSAMSSTSAAAAAASSAVTANCCTGCSGSEPLPLARSAKVHTTGCVALQANKSCHNHSSRSEEHTSELQSLAY